MGFVLLQTFYFSPIGVTKLEELKFKILKKQTRINLSVQRINNFLGQKLIYIFEKENDLLKGVFIADWNDPENNAIIEAKQGKIFLNDANQKIYFQLADGKIHFQPSDMDYRIVEFEQMIYHLNPETLDSTESPRLSKSSANQTKEKKDTELTLGELLKMIRGSEPGSTELLEYIEELHGRIVTILSCICLAIFALPIAIQDPRSPKSGSILYIFIGLIIYFYLFAQARSLLVQGRVPVIALYTPLIIAVGVGLFNFYKINHNIDSFLQIIRGPSGRQVD